METRKMETCNMETFVLNCLIAGLPYVLLRYFAEYPRDLETLKNAENRLYNLIEGYLADRDLASLYLRASNFAFRKESIPAIYREDNMKKVFLEMLDTFTDTGSAIDPKKSLSFGQICKLLNPMPGRRSYVLKTNTHFWMYEDILSQHEVDKLLEIGIFYGGSTHAWRLRLPNAKLFSMDINYPLQDSKILERCQSNFYQGSAVCIRDVKAICSSSPFDMVIDDASHLVSHQIFTFLLFVVERACRNVYVIEDINLEDGSDLSFMRFFQALLRYQKTLDFDSFIIALKPFVTNDTNEIFELVVNSKKSLEQISLFKMVFYADNLCIHV